MTEQDLVGELVVRAERENDSRRIREVNLAAFEGEEEAVIVERLRSSDRLVASLVAEHQGQVVGHILFSTVSLEPAVPGVRAAGLAPMAVIPELQRRGVGSRLVEEGLAACRRSGFDAVVVLGHADYYPRFGFRPAGRFGLSTTYEVPAEVFMALELRANALAGVRATVRYAPEFG